MFIASPKRNDDVITHISTPLMFIAVKGMMLSSHTFLILLCLLLLLKGMMLSLHTFLLLLCLLPQRDLLASLLAPAGRLPPETSAVPFSPSAHFSVTFTLKTFVDEFTTEEVKITAEEGKTVLEVAQDNGATINGRCRMEHKRIAFCGGNCHCGGCQIKLSQYLTDRIPRPTDKEKEVLKKCVDVDER